MEAGLGGADRHDEVGLDERRMEPQRRAPPTVSGRRSSASQSWTTISAAEVTRPVGAQESLELAATRAPAEAGGDEHA